MDVSRRKFLGAFSASVAAILSFGGRVATGQTFFTRITGSPTGGISSDELAQLGWSSFNEHLETDFSFSSLQAGRRGARPARLRLVSIKDEDALRKDDSIKEPRCFVLTFSQASRSVPLRQDTYVVDHYALGRFELFISDAGVTDTGFIYTAIINRIEG